MAVQRPVPANPAKFLKVAFCLRPSPTLAGDRNGCHAASVDREHDLSYVSEVGRTRVGEALCVSTLGGTIGILGVHLGVQVPWRRRESTNISHAFAFAFAASWGFETESVPQGAEKPWDSVVDSYHARVVPDGRPRQASDLQSQWGRPVTANGRSPPVFAPAKQRNLAARPYLGHLTRPRSSCPPSSTSSPTPSFHPLYSSVQNGNRQGTRPKGRQLVQHRRRSVHPRPNELSWRT